MKSIDEILKELDAIYEKNQGKDAEALMLGYLDEARAEGEKSIELQLLNELIGFYREASRVEDSYRVSREAVELSLDMGLSGTIPHATTLLNVGGAYRAAGNEAEALEFYNAAGEIYKNELSEDDLLIASLENNIALVYQELGDFVQAKEHLKKALSVVRRAGRYFETAVSLSNLAATCLELDDLETAGEYAKEAVSIFEDKNVVDAHYCAALSSLATYRYRKGEYEAAAGLFEKAMGIMEQVLGRNEQYNRLKSNMEMCREKARLSTEEGVRQDMALNENARLCGLDICRLYYEEYGRPMIEEKFPEYADRIAVGLVGEGSDCFGLDDEYSRDHDWGPSFCMWVSEDTYEKTGEKLKEAYNELPLEFMGYKRTVSPNGRDRRGVCIISRFYERLVGATEYEKIDWRSVSDSQLSASVNGEVFRDDEGIFTEFREKLMKGYPENIRYLKLAEAASLYSQNAQYNYFRMLRRRQGISAKLVLSEGIKNALKLYCYMENIYPIHDKWLYSYVEALEGNHFDEDKGETLIALINQLSYGANRLADDITKSDVDEYVFTDEGFEAFTAQVKSLTEAIGAYFSEELYRRSIISDVETYLDYHADELVKKSSIAMLTEEELAEEIARYEFKAFDKVQNEGGRAYCQDDWPTFRIMRMSQYLTWNRTMLMQYWYDFDREYNLGHNLITEKYGRMEESTTPDEYDRIKENFPELSDEKKAVIEGIVSIQVKWMEEFSKDYPYLSANARTIRTAEDELYDTSYETYLRGEISTYSDKMLQLYGVFIADYVRDGRNLARDTIFNSVKLYGYKTLEDAEHFYSL